MKIFTRKSQNMKRILILFLSMLMLSGIVNAKKSYGLSELESLQGATFMTATAPMLRSGLDLSQFSIPKDATTSMTLFQMVSVGMGAGSGEMQEARDCVTSFIDKNDLELVMAMSSGRSNIKVWGNAGKNDIFTKVIIGIGTRTGLTYFLLEGEITGQVISNILNYWQ